jgi:hypothetical protein
MSFDGSVALGERFNTYIRILFLPRLSRKGPSRTCVKYEAHASIVSDAGTFHIFVLDFAAGILMARFGDYTDGDKAEKKQIPRSARNDMLSTAAAALADGAGTTELKRVR